MEFSSSPLSPVPINFDEASIAGSNAQPSPVKLHDQFDRMPRVSRSRPRPSTQIVSTGDCEAEYVATRKPKSQKQSQKRVAQSSPKALEPRRSKLTRRGGQNAISYAESDSEDEPAGAPDRETSSEIDVDSTPVKPEVCETQDIVSVASASPPESTDTKVKPTPVRKRLPLRGNWSVSHLLQSDKSKLKDCDLEALLSHPKAWSALSQEEQQELCALLPSSAIGSSSPTSTDSLPNLPQRLLKTNSTFRSHLRLFQEELAAGRFDPVWLADAQAAMEKRAAGTFDAWKESEREKFWGQKQKPAWLAVAGDSAKWSLADMVRGGCFQPGDVWVVSRSLRRKEAPVTVQKEATLRTIAADWSLEFTFPPAQHTLSAPGNGEDKHVAGVDNPNALAKAIVTEDGRIPASHRSPNAWREVRCLRRNQDMGSLWDVRETFHLKQSAK